MHCTCFLIARHISKRGRGLRKHERTGSFAGVQYLDLIYFMERIFGEEKNEGNENFWKGGKKF